MQTSAQWLAILESRHPTAIDMGLDRVRAVWEALGAPRPAPVCVVVGGTNGKGSTVAMLAAIYRAAGYRVGTYTSPHIHRYHERVAVDGEPIPDPALVAAFERVEAARGAVSLTYFEFGTLAAFVHLAGAGLDVAMLEIGLGGRLDAVNLIDGDASILTSVDLDHQAYLGDTREQIGWEKAHIFRAGKPAVIGEPHVPATVLAVAGQVGAEVFAVGREFWAEVEGEGWRFGVGSDASSARSSERRVALGAFALAPLPLPALRAPCQLRNAACAVMTTQLLRGRLPVTHEAIASGLINVKLAGRLQRLDRVVETWADVAHNPESARTLAAWLATQPARTTIAVFAALADKDLAGIALPLQSAFAHWITVELRPDPRAVGAEELALRLQNLGIAATPAANADAALEQADRLARADGRIVIFGSFHTVAQFA